MAVYTVHLPETAPASARPDYERLVVVRDGFAPLALIFTVFWFLYHRLWLGALGVFAATLALGLAARALGFGPEAALAAQLIIGVVIGLEANAIRRWTLEQRGLRMVDVVAARDPADAERRFLDRATAASPPPSVAVASASQSPPRPYGDEVLGLFPAPNPASGGTR